VSIETDIPTLDPCTAVRKPNGGLAGPPKERTGQRSRKTTDEILDSWSRNGAHPGTVVLDQLMVGRVR